MKKSVFLWFIAVNIVLIILWFRLGKVESLSQQETSQHQPLQEQSQKTINEVEADQDQAQAAAQEEHKKTSRLLGEPPPLTLLQNEVKENPHDTPPSLIEFSNFVAERIERSSENTKARLELFSDLVLWATNEGNSEVIRAYSVSVARELSLQNKEFHSRFRDLENSLPPRILQLSQI